MKAFFKTVLCCCVSVLFASSAFAQVDFNHPKFAKYGDTAEQREANYMEYSFFRDDVKLKSYKSAIERLDKLVVAAPEATENIYILGASAYKSLIGSEASETQKQAYIDKLLALYDLRDKHFGGDKSKIILANKALDMMRYRADDIPAIRKTVANAIAKSGDDVSMDMALQYFNLIVNDYIRNTKVDATDLLEDFDMVNTAVAKSNNELEKTKVLLSLDELLLQSGAANCDNLEKIFKPKYQANPNDADLIRKTASYLARNDCKGAFATEMSEKYYGINPSAESAFALGVAFANDNQDAKAQKYFKEAVSLDPKNPQISKYLLRYTGHELLMGRPMSAARLAKDAIAADPNNYLPYMLLAQAYASGANSSGCDGFNKKAIFLLVVDNLQKAKSMTSDSGEIQKLNDMIRTYSAYFPTKEDIFFQEGLRVGGGVTVNCGWISGGTTIRTSN